MKLRLLLNQRSSKNLKMHSFYLLQITEKFPELQRPLVPKNLWLFRPKKFLRRQRRRKHQYVFSQAISDLFQQRIRRGDSDSDSEMTEESEDSFDDTTNSAIGAFMRDASAKWKVLSPEKRGVKMILFL